MLLDIKDLSVQVNDQPVIKGLTLALPEAPGVHVIMGPNGSGKSSLCNVIMGHPDYTVTQGEVVFKGLNLLELETDERARAGLFLSFQHPREIPGVSLVQVMKAAANARLTEQGAGEPIGVKDLLADLRTELQTFNLKEEFLARPLNEGASGGEKKRLEMLQLSSLRPRLAVLDEIDSGLDIDAVKQIAGSIKSLVEDAGLTFLIVTHYQRLLQYIKPSSVHVMVDGKVVVSGDHTLAEKLEAEGYKNYV